MRKFLLLLLLFPLISAMGQKQVYCHAMPKHNVRFSNNLYDAGLSDNFYYWDTGKTLYIRFLNGGNSLKAAIELIADEWTKYANIKFEFRDKGDAHIRIALNDSLFNASMGLMANTYPIDEANVLIDTSGFSNKKFMRAMVLHMFGHVLGLEHENIVPASGRKWNTGKVENYFFARGWDQSMINRNVIEPYSVSRTNGFIADMNSIMYQSLPAAWTNEKYRPVNTELSLADVSLIRDIYPFAVGSQPQNQFFTVQKYDGTMVELNKHGFCFFPQFELKLEERGALYFSILLYDEDGNPIIHPGADYILDDQVATTKAFSLSQPGKISVSRLRNGLGLFLPFDQIPYQYKGKKIMAKFKVFVPNIYKEEEIRDFDSPPFYISVPK